MPARTVVNRLGTAARRSLVAVAALPAAVVAGAGLATLPAAIGQSATWLSEARDALLLSAASTFSAISSW
jgi:hypothetical protein